KVMARESMAGTLIQGRKWPQPQAQESQGPSFGSAALLIPEDFSGGYPRGAARRVNRRQETHEHGCRRDPDAIVRARLEGYEAERVDGLVERHPPVLVRKVTQRVPRRQADGAAGHPDQH